MTTDERIKRVREAVEKLRKTSQKADEISASFPEFDRQVVFTDNSGAVWEFADRLEDIAAILDEREAEREVVQRAIEYSESQSGPYQGDELIFAVRRLLEVRREQTARSETQAVVD